MADIVVTGGAGFIGSHLCDSLITEGHSVRAVDDLTTGRRENLSHLLGHPDFQLIEADILKEGVLAESLADAQVIYHLAARVGVQRVLDSALATIDDNTGCTREVADAALKSGAVLVYASTSEVYGRNEKVPFNEEDDLTLGPPHVGRWAYAASKILDEHYLLALAREKGLKVSIARLFNTVGPRQLPDYGMVLPRFASAALRDEPLNIIGDGKQTRCFTWVGDAVRALQMLASNPKAKGQVFNIGSCEESSILELGALVVNAAGSGRLEHVTPGSLGSNYADMRRRVPDVSKIEKVLGWKAETPTEQIVARTVEWWRTRI
ncbi:MAG: NAD-dependent epimerase/dehydratase family protein [Planctomycetota bacterium]|nr:NAD-dependent epimerase/dehydratase family protein [Planctomycetota bacterium]